MPSTNAISCPSASTSCGAKLRVAITWDKQKIWNEELDYHNANYSLALKSRGPREFVFSEGYATRSEAVPHLTETQRTEG